MAAEHVAGKIRPDLLEMVVCKTVYNKRQTHVFHVLLVIIIFYMCLLPVPGNIDEPSDGHAVVHRRRL